MICNGSPIPVTTAQYLEFWNHYLEMQQDMLKIMNTQIPLADAWMRLYMDMLDTMVLKDHAR